MRNLVSMISIFVLKMVSFGLWKINNVLPYMVNGWVAFMPLWDTCVA